MRVEARHNYKYEFRLSQKPPLFRPVQTSKGEVYTTLITAESLEQANAKLRLFAKDLLKELGDE